MSDWGAPMSEQHELANTLLRMDEALRVHQALITDWCTSNSVLSFLCKLSEKMRPKIALAFFAAINLVSRPVQSSFSAAQRLQH